MNPMKTTWLSRAFRYTINVLAAVLIGSQTLIPTTLNAAATQVDLSKIPQFSNDRILVAFVPGTPAATVASIHGQNGGTVLKSLTAIGVQVVSIKENSVEQKIRAYQENPNVKFAEKNYLRPMIIPDEGQESEPPNGIGDYFKEQWGLHNTGQAYSYEVDPISEEISQLAIPVEPDADIDAPEGWDIFLNDCPDTNTCTPSRIAILDSGVDCSHVDLNCIHDVNVVATHVTGVPDGDVIGHGTHVAGIAAATNNNNLGIAGVAWSSLIGSFKVCYGYPLSFPVIGLCDSAAIAEGIYTAADMGYDVINMSFGGPGISAAESAAIDYAWNKGIVLVASVGNEYQNGRCSAPATHPSVIAVGATDYHDNISSFSNFGDCASVLAPGTNVISTFPNAACEMDPNGCYVFQSGTSMASPMVAGAAGLLKTLLGSSATNNAAIRGHIEQNADATGARGQNMLSWSQHGRINLASALIAAGGTPPSPPPPPVDTVYVGGISFALRGPNLSTTVTVNRSSDGAPVSAAVLTVSMCNAFGGCNFTTTQAETDNKGQVGYKLLQPSGSYTFTVHSISHDQYNYSPSLDVNNPAIYYP